MRQPESNRQLPLKPAVKSGKTKSKIKNPEKEIDRDVPSIKEEKIPFAIVRLCLNNAITDPLQDLSEVSHLNSKHNKYGHCREDVVTKAPIKNIFSMSEECYISFDNLILEILDYMIRNKIAALNDDKEFFCNELSNLINKIMKLISSDFNIRIPTKTNIEFTVNIILTYLSKKLENFGIHS